MHDNILLCHPPPKHLKMANKKNKNKWTQNVSATTSEPGLSAYVFVIVHMTLTQLFTQLHLSAKKLFTTLCRLVPLTPQTHTTQIRSPLYQNVIQTPLSLLPSPATHLTSIQTKIDTVGQLQSQALTLTTHSNTAQQTGTKKKKSTQPCKHAITHNALHTIQPPLSHLSIAPLTVPNWASCATLWRCTRSPVRVNNS